MVKQRRFTIEEKARVSPLSLILGFGPVVLIAIGVITVWLVPARIQTETIDLTIVWAASDPHIFRRGASWPQLQDAGRCDICSNLDFTHAVFAWNPCATAHNERHAFASVNFGLARLLSGAGW